MKNKLNHAVKLMFCFNNIEYSRRESMHDELLSIGMTYTVYYYI